MLKMELRQIEEENRAAEEAEKMEALEKKREERRKQKKVWQLIRWTLQKFMWAYFCMAVNAACIFIKRDVKVMDFLGNEENDLFGVLKISKKETDHSAGSDSLVLRLCRMEEDKLWQTRASRLGHIICAHDSNICTSVRVRS